MAIALKTLSAAAAGLLLTACAGLGPAPAYDLVLKGGVVVDGTGAPRRQADVAVKDDRIVRIAEAIPAGQAALVLDVQGLVVAPGFIEPHAHISDIDQHPDAENYLRQGVTTIVASLHSVDQPYPLGVYLDGLKVAPNTAWTAGHTWIRKRVMGLADREPMAPELAAMQALVSQAMDEGALGLGTGLEYIPAAYSKTDEITALARSAARPGAVYITHLRDEGARLTEAVDEAIAVGRASATPVRINHIKVTGSSHFGGSAAILARIDAANAQGAGVSFDVYPYTAYSTTSDVLFPAWALAGGDQAYRARIADPAARSRIKAEMLAIFPSQTGGVLESIQFRQMAGGGDQFRGQTLADYMRAKAIPLTLDAGIDALIDIQTGGDFIGIFHAMAQDDVDAFLTHPQGSVSADGDLIRYGEGFPHPRSYGAFPRVLGVYVRERGLLSLEAAVRKMTSVSADDLGLKDRGRLRPGAKADIVVFDAAAIADKATFTQPHQYAVGIRHLFVNGQAVIADAALTGRRPGQVIRRGD